MSDEQLIDRMKLSGWKWDPKREEFTRSHKKERVSFAHVKLFWVKNGILFQPQMQLPFK